jgi:Tol biopolymer transport system component
MRGVTGQWRRCALKCSVIPVAISAWTLVAPQAGLAAHDDLVKASPNPVAESENPAAFVRGLSDDGAVVAFETDDPLTAADLDDESDLYVSRGGDVILASPDPNPSDSSMYVEFAAINSEGTKVWFETLESLAANDSEPVFERRDVYEFDATTRAVTLVSTGPGDTGGHDARFHDIGRDGDDVYFATKESFSDQDVDGTAGSDVYVRSGGVTQLVSTGPADTDPSPVYAPWADVTGISADGDRVFFSTYERLVSEDIDESLDIYERAGNQTYLISTGPFEDDYPEGESEYGQPTPDGRRVLFVTDQKLVPEDGDGRDDIYQRIDRTTTRLVTPDPQRFHCCGEWLDVEGQSPDGDRVFFVSDQPYVAGDTDQSEDAYVVDGAAIKLVAGAGQPYVDDLPRIEPSGEFAAFSTGIPLVPADDDQRQDVYLGDGDEVRLASDAPGVGSSPDAALFRTASADLSRIFFSTLESMSPADTDPAPGLYEFVEGELTYLGTITGSFGFGLDAVHASDNGRVVAFQSNARLTPTDCDEGSDVFVASIDPWALGQPAEPGCEVPPNDPGAPPGPQDPSNPTNPPAPPSPQQPDEPKPSPPNAQPDTVSPAISIEPIESRTDGRRVSRINVVWACDEPCRAKVQLSGRDQTLATVREPLGAGVRVTRLDACAKRTKLECRRRLARADTKQLRLTIVGHDAAGNRSRRSLELGS